jgi:hypothetical protein
MSTGLEVLIGLAIFLVASAIILRPILVDIKK